MIVRALGTSDPQEARERRDEAWAKLTAEFKSLRAELAGQNKGEPTAAPPSKKREYTPTLDIGRAARRVEAERRDAYSEGRLREWYDERQEEMQRHQAVLSGAIEPWLPFYDHEVRLGALQAALESKWRPARPAAAPVNVAEGPAGQYLSDIVDKWAAEQGPRAKTLRKTQVIVAEFDALTDGAAIGAVTPDHVQAYKEQLVASGVAPATGNNKLNLLRAVIRFALASRIIKADPCDGISIKPGKGRAKARIAYERDHLTALFGSAVWAADERPVAGKGEAAYWLPLLALYSGARLEELGQLRLSDIGPETYLTADDSEAVATVFRIVEDEADGLTVKNAGSVRRVPVHPELIRLGFLRYVEGLRAEGEKWLFPDLDPDRDGTRTAAWSKWYGRWLRTKAKVTDKRVTFHSFRHSFKHYARQVGIAPDVQNEITGHDTGDIADDYGGLSYPLHPLVEAMDRYRVPGFTPPAPPPAYRSPV